jgi:hypothetical protein
VRPELEEEVATTGARCRGKSKRLAEQRQSAINVGQKSEWDLGRAKESALAHIVSLARLSEVPHGYLERR